MRRSGPRGGSAADLPGVAIELADGGTIRVRYSAGVRIREPEAQQILSRVQELAGGRLRPVLVELAGLGSISAAAMALFANRLPVSRMALVGMSPVDVAVAKFFSTVHRPPYPVEYFSSSPEALAWLGPESRESGSADPGPSGPVPTSAGAYASAFPDSGPAVPGPGGIPGPARRASGTSGAQVPDRDADRSHRQAAIPERPTRAARLRKKLAGMFTRAAAPEAAGGRHQRTGIDTPPPARPVSAETLRQVTEAFHGRTGSKSFPKALAVAAALNYDHAGAFAGLLSRCPPAERDLIATHLYRHFLHSPRQLALWVKTAGHNYFYARATVANTGIGRARARPGRISTARRTDRDSAGFNVAQEARDAVALINGLVRSHWPGHLGPEAQHNIISLAAALARLLITEGDDHPLAASYREYTDLYGVRHSIVENGTGLIDLILKHPQTTGLLCEYIQSGRHNGPEGLRRAVLNSSRMLRGQRPGTTEGTEGTPGRD
ncbi:DUF7793 family protein [Arthrobacter mobilis]|uniref:DUF7793 domain-containing protein n=1 Tax=Arthrobacter mobilis TaxID=2724944 RepID=A0A7X6K4J1_9MICC|nr:hypothetical protein [Arthrobacter mobilis]NKX55387.1 hypothetical protein [Arthrobacter mobilis]